VTTFSVLTSTQIVTPEDPYNQVDVSNMFPQSMDDPVRWETCEPVQDADAEPEADAEPVAEQTDLVR
jgi:hypothetical protein